MKKNTYEIEDIVIKFINYLEEQNEKMLQIENGTGQSTELYRLSQCNYINASQTKQIISKFRKKLECIQEMIEKNKRTIKNIVENFYTCIYKKIEL